MIRLFRVFIPTSVLGLLASEFLLIYACYLAGAFLVYQLITVEFDPQFFLFSDNGLVRIGLIVGCIMLGIYFHDLYAKFRINSKILLIQQLCLVIGIAFLTQALLTYLKRPEWTVPKWLMIFGSLLTLVLLPAWRLFYSTVVSKALGSQRVLFLGSSPIVREIAAHIHDHPELGLAPIGYVDDLEPGTDLPGANSSAPYRELPGIVAAAQAAPHRGGDDRAAPAPPRQRPAGSSLFRHPHRGGAHHLRDAPSAESPSANSVPSQLIFSAELGPAGPSVFWHMIYSFRHRGRFSSSSFRPHAAGGHRGEAHLQGSCLSPPEACRPE